jgi:hypothetical protein
LPAAHPIRCEHGGAGILDPKNRVSGEEATRAEDAVPEGLWDRPAFLKEERWIYDETIAGRYGKGARSPGQLGEVVAVEEAAIADRLGDLSLRREEADSKEVFLLGVCQIKLEVAVCIADLAKEVEELAVRAFFNTMPRKGTAPKGNLHNEAVGGGKLAVGRGLPLERPYDLRVGIEDDLVRIHRRRLS